jgi:hypothetical protein
MEKELIYQKQIYEKFCDDVCCDEPHEFRHLVVNIIKFKGKEPVVEVSKFFTYDYGTYLKTKNQILAVVGLSKMVSIIKHNKDITKFNDDIHKIPSLDEETNEYAYLYARGTRDSIIKDQVKEMYKKCYDTLKTRIAKL